MSWDAYIYFKEQCRKCGEPHAGRMAEFDWNYTSNTVEMLQAAAVATGWVNPNTYVGEILRDYVDGEEFCKRMQACIDWMRVHRVEMASMNPKNGWGDSESFRVELQRWVNAVREHIAEHGGAMTSVSQ